MLTIDLTHTYMDVIEFKFILVLITIGIAIWLGNKLYDKRKNNSKEE